MKEEQTRYKAARSAQSACTITALAIFDILYAVQLSHHTTYTGLLDLDAGRLARSQNPEGPATGHLDPGFLGFPGS